MDQKSLVAKNYFVEFQPKTPKHRLAKQCVYLTLNFKIIGKALD